MSWSAGVFSSLTSRPSPVQNSVARPGPSQVFRLARQGWSSVVQCGPVWGSSSGARGGSGVVVQTEGRGTHRCYQGCRQAGLHTKIFLSQLWNIIYLSSQVWCNTVLEHSGLLYVLVVTWPDHRPLTPLHSFHQSMKCEGRFHSDWNSHWGVGSTECGQPAPAELGNMNHFV